VPRRGTNGQIPSRRALASLEWVSGHKRSRAALTISLIRGDAADELLRDPTFQKAWSDLAAACPWSTSCQSWAFAEAWIESYLETYELLLVVQYNKADGLNGLLPLAVHRNSGQIKHVGAHQAEYQVWLARETQADLFIENALDALAVEYPRQRLRLQYLPPGSPLGWTERQHRWGAHTTIREKKLPLLRLGSNSSVEQSLRKKGNKSRINRLQKVAPLRLVQLHTPEELASVLDDVSDFCDLRQGAINSVLPFRDDPQKRAFCLRMIEKPGLLHAAVLMSGDSVIAANIGQINRSSVSVGILCHSPFLAGQSPGKILLLMLARELGRQGFSDLDLTAGGDSYKDRSADHYERVHTIDVYFGRTRYSGARVGAYIRHEASRLLGTRAQVLSARLRRMAKAPMPAIVEQAISMARLQTPRRKSRQFHAILAEQARQLQATQVLRVNCISDLLSYQPSGRFDRSKSAFLSNACRRLEAGDWAYTFSENEVLLYCTWISRARPGEGPDGDDGFACPPRSCLLWDDYLHPSVKARELQSMSLAQRLRDAARIPDIDTILVQSENSIVLPESILEAELNISKSLPILSRIWFGPSIGEKVGGIGTELDLRHRRTREEISGQGR
jgi:CelD/BcsL family acetyltransferase involved in cellulose biosynthesis